MLDTNTVSYILKGRSAKARARLAELSDAERACISAITQGELFYGLAKAGSSAECRKALDWFLARLKAHTWDTQAASAYGLLRAKQEKKGKTLGPLDMQIAAHSIAVGAILVSSDSAFHHVSDLIGLENWTTDI
jgi:tRNA(fMet)-specific endonuclease VapC